MLKILKKIQKCVKKNKISKKGFQRKIEKKKKSFFQARGTQSQSFIWCSCGGRIHILLCPLAELGEWWLFRAICWRWQLWSAWSAGSRTVCRAFASVVPTLFDVGVAVLTGSMWKKKVDFFFTNQSSAKIEIAENLHWRSDHKPLRLSRPHAQGIMLEFEKKKKSLAGWSPQTSSQRHELVGMLHTWTFDWNWTTIRWRSFQTERTDRIDHAARFYPLKPWSIVASGITGPPHGSETETFGERIERESCERKEAGVAAHSGWKKCEQTSSCRSLEFWGLIGGRSKPLGRHDSRAFWKEIPSRQRATTGSDTYIVEVQSALDPVAWSKKKELSEEFVEVLSLVKHPARCPPVATLGFCASSPSRSRISCTGLGGIWYLLGAEERRHHKVEQLASNLAGSYTVTKCMNRFRDSWWDSGWVCSAWTLSPSWWRVGVKRTNGGKSCLTPGVGRCASGKRGDNRHCGGCCEGEFGSVCEAVHGQHKKSPFQTGSGNETRRPEDYIRMEPSDGSIDWVFQHDCAVCLIQFVMLAFLRDAFVSARSCTSGQSVASKKKKVFKKKKFQKKKSFQKKKFSKKKNIQKKKKKFQKKKKFIRRTTLTTDMQSWRQVLRSVWRCMRCCVFQTPVVRCG